VDVDDFHNRLRDLYLPPADRFTMVEVPAIRFAVIDGHGNPQDDEGAAAARWLYSVAHLVKPLVRERMGKTFVDPPLECLLWVDEMSDLADGNRDNWHWRMMLVFIDWITPEKFEEAVAKAAAKRGPAPASLRLAQLYEGTSVQIMHVGDYSGVAALCAKLYNEFLPQNGLRPNGAYHEIYLNDPARTAPNKRRLVIRQPVTTEFS
jgi:hypothetical protein